MNDLVDARRMPSGGCLGNFKKYMYVFENKGVKMAHKNGETATFLFTCENLCNSSSSLQQIYGGSVQVLQ
jgi:hypothetical protein